VGALGATHLAATDFLLAEVYLGLDFGIHRPGPLELSPGENVEAAQLVIVEFFDRIEEVPVEGHQATDSGANNLVVVRRSVRVHPWGGVIRSAWLAQSEYP
jgi:hypothetical protein